MVLPFPCRGFPRCRDCRRAVLPRRSRAAGRSSLRRRLPPPLYLSCASRPGGSRVACSQARVHYCASCVGRRNGASHRDTTPHSTKKLASTLCTPVTRIVASSKSMAPGPGFATVLSRMKGVGAVVKKPIWPAPVRSWTRSRRCRFMPSIKFRRFILIAHGPLVAVMSYSANYVDLFRQIGVQYVGRILKGTRPADLPVQRSSKFELGDQSQDRQGARS